VDDHKSLMRRFVDEFQSKGDEAVADELLADNFRNHTPPPGMSPGKQGVKAYFAAFRRAVPNLHAQVHDMLADGDTVVTRKTFHGTHTGEFLGLPRTGNARWEASRRLRDSGHPP
jgi:predicted ester cyclase